MSKQKMGIYKIENKVNGKVYIGSTKNVDTRFYNHRRTLNSGNHHNHHLQNSWDKHGEDNFEFILIEEVKSAKALFETEQGYLDNMLNEENKYDKSKYYNIVPNAAGGIPTLTKEQVEKVCTLYKNGDENCSSLANMFDCGRGTILSYLKSNGIPSRSSRDIHDGLTDEQIDQFIEDYNNGENIYRLSEKYDVSRTTLYRYLDKRGIEYKSPYHLDQEGKDEIVSLYKKGYTAEMIEENIGFGQTAIWRTIRQHKEEHGPIDKATTMTKRAKITRKDEQEICERYSNGESPQSLADEFDVHDSTIYRYLRENDVYTPVKRTILTDEIIDKIMELYEQNLSGHAIAKQVPVSKTTVYRTIKKNTQ